MLHAQFSYFDMIVFGIMLLSCLFAFFRGFVKEVLSLGAWLGAGVVTVYYFQDVAKWMEPHFKGKQMVAGGIAALGLYISCLVAFSLLNSLIMRFIKEGSDVGILDNSLGLFFGAFRGAVLVSLGYLIMSMVVPSDNEHAPEWLKHAATKPYAEHGAVLLARIAPDYLQDHSSLKKRIDTHEERYPDIRDIREADFAPAAGGGKSLTKEDLETEQSVSPAELERLIKTMKKKEQAN